jgi:hypothetical protein
VTYELNVYCSEVTAMAKLYTALHRNILDVFNEHGIQIMTPRYGGDPPEPKTAPRDHQYAKPISAEASAGRPTSADPRAGKREERRS